MKTKKSKIEPRRSKWRAWMSVASVFAGVTLITGATVLGVFLTGGFEEKVVSPDSIEFDYGGYVFNNDFSQLEISTNNIQTNSVTGEKFFTLSITSPTEDVTNDRVELSFVGNGQVIESEGEISNTIIKVPKYVYIGQPFTVKVMEERLYEENLDGTPVDSDVIAPGVQYKYIMNGEQYATNIKGGLTTLRATSEYSQISPTELKIAVDTPVYNTKLRVFDMAGYEIAPNAKNNINDPDEFTLIAGENFTADSKYIPFRSRFMFGDTSREKHTFYSCESQLVSARYDEDYEVLFSSSQQNSEEPIVINSYTFKYADSEIAYMDSMEGTNQTPADFYISSISYLASNEAVCQHTTQNISLGNASIKSFQINNKSLKDVKINKTFKLYLNNYPQDKEGDYLNASIISNTIENRELYSELKNVAIRFTCNGADAVGSYITLTNCEMVTIGKDADAKNYYKPNTSVADIRYAYWEIATLDKGETTISLEIVLLEQGAAEGEYTSFEDKHELTLSIKTHSEGEVAWASEEEIKVELIYDGTETQDQVISNLLSLVNIPKENQFQDVMFFADFGDNEEEAKAKADKIIGATGHDVMIELNTPKGAKKLFPLRGLSLTLKDTGEFDLYFATIDRSKDDYSQMIQKWCETAKRIISQKSLHAGSVDQEATLSMTDQKIYTGDTTSTLSITFNIAEDSIPAFKDNYKNMTIQLLGNSKTGTSDITSFFELQGEGEFNEENKTYTLSYKLKSAVSIDLEYDDKINTCQIYQAILIFNQGETGEINWPSDVSDQNVLVYNPLTASITSTVTEETKSFKVVQRLKTDGEYSLNITSLDEERLYVSTQDGKTARYDSLAEFIEALHGAITVTDQHGNTQSLANNWKFVTTNSSAIQINSQTFEFGKSTATGVSLQIKSDDVACKTGAGQTIQYTFDIDSTGVASLKYSTYDKTEKMMVTKESNDVGSVMIDMLGEKDETITLSDLIDFYLEEDCNGEAYAPYGTNAIQYEVNHQTSASLTTAQQTDLKAMIDMSWDEPTTIKINFDFGRDVTLVFNITANGLSTTLHLNILANKEIDGSMEYGKTQILYADTDLELTNKIVDITSQSTDDTLLSRYSDDTYYIIPAGEGADHYVISSKDDKGSNIGQISTDNTTTNIKFNDFWDSESKKFTVLFTPDGANSFTLSAEIDFYVTRNIAISTENAEASFFNIYGTNEANAQVRNISSFVSITRADGSGKSLFGDNDDLPEGLSFAFLGENIYLEYNDSNATLDRNDTQMHFGYNNDTLTQKIAVMSGKAEIGQFEIKIKLLEDVYSTVAKNIKNVYQNGEEPETTTAGEIQKINGVRYIAFDLASSNTNQWSRSSIANGNIQIIRNDGIYSLTGDSVTGEITFSQGGTLLNGLDDQNKYIALRTKDAKEFMYIPAIVSSIGLNPIRYDGDADVTENSLEIALLSEEYLLSEANLNDKHYYAEFNAGAEYDLSSYISRINSNSNVSLSFDSKYIKSATGNGDNSAFVVVLNHVADRSQEHYAIIKVTIEDGISRVLNFLIKILPDAYIEEPIYPYVESSTEKSVENITADIGTINLDDKNLSEIYGQTTLHNNEKRFNVYKKPNKTETIEGLTYKNEIEKVVINDIESSPLTLPADWERYITLSFNEKSDTLTYQVKSGVTDRIKVTIRRSYPGGEGAEELSVIGGEQYYNFTFNDHSKNYSVRFNWDSKTENILDTDTDKVFDQISIRNGVDGAEGSGFDWSNDGGTYTVLKINLIENAIAGQVESGNVIYNILNVVCSEGEDFLREDTVPGSDPADIRKYYYNKATGELTLYTNDWIAQDGVIKFAIFTDQGYLASLHINILSNVTVTIKQNELTGGSDLQVDNVYVLSQGASSRTFTSQQVDGINVTYLAFDGNGNITVPDLATDKIVDATIKTTFNGGNTFTFSTRFTLKANVTAANISASTPVVAGSKICYNQSNWGEEGQKKSLISLLAEGHKRDIQSVSITSSSPAFAGHDITGNETDHNIAIAYVATNTVVTVTFELQLNSFETIKPTYTFTVVPAVIPNVYYPRPSGGSQLEYEYIKSGTEFAVSGLIKEGAKYATDNHKRVKFIDSNATQVDKDITYRLKSLSNATVKRDGSVLTANTALNATDNITFTRGTNGNDNGNDSIVVIAISCMGVTTEYEFRILATVESVVFNTVTNNTTNGVETIYVDKINTQHLFAAGRMAEVTFNERGETSEYYAVFVDNETDPINIVLSQAFYIKASDLGQTRIIDLGRGMAGKHFIGMVLAQTIESYGIKLSDTGLIEQGSLPKDVNFTEYLSDIVSQDAFILKNRIQLIYGEHEVKYDYYEQDINLLKGEVNSDLDILGNGEIKGQVSDVSFTYKYTPDVDINVAQNVATGGNFITLEVNEEYAKISQIFKITHPTSGLYLSPTDGDTANISIDTFDPFESINGRYTYDEDIRERFEGYQKLDGYDGFKTGIAPKQYLRFAQVKNTNDKIYDFNLFPQGADNDGDYVAIKFSYGYSTFKKDFYFVVKIVSDYVVSFGGNPENATIEIEGKDQIISNINNIYEITDKITDGSIYTEFSLIGKNSHVSITHKNGSNTNTEFSLSAFTIKIPINKGNYNLSSNLTYSGIAARKGITKVGDYYTVSDSNDDGTIGLPDVKVVQFADQYYFFEGTDAYGYKYRVYFMLALDGESPKAINEGSITEGKQFTVGLEYEERTYPEGSNDYTSVIKQPDATIVLNGISGAYTNSGSNISEFNPNVTITDYNIYSEDGNTLYLDCSVTSSGVKFGKGHIANVANSFPYLPGEAYGLSNTARVKIVLTLQSDSKECYQLSAYVNVTRAAQITTTANNAVRDGTPFALSGHLNVGGKAISGGAINDTLEVLVAKASIATFDITVSNEASDLYNITKSIELNNKGRNVATTFYLSLSEIFDKILCETDYMTVKNMLNVQDISYMTEDSLNDVKDSVTFGESCTIDIKRVYNDCLYIEDKSLIENNDYTNVTKYYIVQANDKNYRVARTYAVTGFYYKLQQKGSDEVILCLTNNNVNYYSDWANVAFDLYGAKNTSTGLAVDTSLTIQFDNKLRFYIEQDGSSFVGNATIVAETGAIYLSSNQLSDDEYIKVRIEMIVSGADRNFGNAEGDTKPDGGTIILATLKLGLKVSN